jgi:hypothetical protein
MIVSRRSFCALYNDSSTVLYYRLAGGSVSLRKIGAEGQNRTVDTSLFRAVLCQLSYLGTEMEAGWHCYRNDW